MARQSCLAEQKKGVASSGVEYGDVRRVFVSARAERANDDVGDCIQVVGLFGMLALLRRQPVEEHAHEVLDA